MEPGHEDREYVDAQLLHRGRRIASMEPGHEDREYPEPRRGPSIQQKASMEPGHEDREYAPLLPYNTTNFWPQWSPVMKTGNTSEDG